MHEPTNPTADRIRAAGIMRPLNWADMGSGERDQWEQRMIRAIERGRATRTFPTDNSETRQEG